MVFSPKEVSKRCVTVEERGSMVHRHGTEDLGSILDCASGLLQSVIAEVTLLCASVSPPSCVHLIYLDFDLVLIWGFCVLQKYR